MSCQNGWIDTSDYFVCNRVLLNLVAYYAHCISYSKFLTISDARDRSLTRQVSILCPPFWILESRITHVQKSCLFNVTQKTRRTGPKPQLGANRPEFKKRVTPKEKVHIIKMTGIRTRVWHYQGSVATVYPYLLHQLLKLCKYILKLDL